jgi:AraC-like DNA-binding protein
MLAERTKPADDGVVSDDAHVLRDVVQRLTVPHYVEASGGRLDGLTRSRRLAQTNLVFVRYGAEVVVEAAPAGERFGLTLPLGPMAVGHSRLSDAGRARTSSFVLDRDRRTLMVPDPHAGALVVAVDHERLRRHLCSVLGYELAGAIEFGANPAWEPVLPARYLDAVVTGTWAATSAVVELPATSARMLEQNLLTALLLGLPHTYSSLLSAAPSDVSTLRARDARIWLEEHYAEAVGVGDLARAISLGVRQLQALFAREHHTSPMEMLRDIRLERAHQLLTEGIGQHLSVTDVALRCGFSHLGRFSGSFRDRFGELPSEMLRNQRGALTGGASGRTGQPSADVLR